MTLTLHLPPELEQRLLQAASHRGLSLDEYTVQLLEKHLPLTDHRTEIVTLLQSWLDEKKLGQQTRLENRDKWGCSRPSFREEAPKSVDCCPNRVRERP